MFLFSAETGQYQAVPVTVRVDGETVAEGAATFASPGEGESVQLVLNASDAIDFGSFNSIVVSIESAAGATTPSGSQFLFTEYLTEHRYSGERGTNENNVILIREDLTKI